MAGLIYYSAGLVGFFLSGYYSSSAPPLSILFFVAGVANLYHSYKEFNE